MRTTHFCRSLYVFLSFFIWPLYRLFFFDLRLLITLSVSSKCSFLIIGISTISEWRWIPFLYYNEQLFQDVMRFCRYFCMLLVFTLEVLTSKVSISYLFIYGSILQTQWQIYTSNKLIWKRSNLPNLKHIRK